MSTPLDTLTEPADLTLTPEPAAEIPPGWVKDKDTGEYRPPKRRGRKPSATPPPADHEPITRIEDTPPDSSAKGKTKNQRGVPRWKEGVIARGMSKFYRRVGRIMKAIDRDLGIAIIESADDCGEAWDEIARTNPRIRAFLLKMITGGGWAALIWAHAPIFMALFMKDSIRKRIPFANFLDVVFERDENGDNEISDDLGGITPEDAQQMMNVMAAGPFGDLVAGFMQGMNRQGFGSNMSGPVVEVDLPEEETGE